MNSAIARSVAFVLLLAVSGCSRRDPAAGADRASTPGGAGDDVLPCFAGGGPVLLKIDGVPVTKGAYECFVALIKARNPAYSDQAAGRFAIENVLVQQAGLYALYRERLPAVSARARAAHARLEKGEDFGAVAREVSDDWSTRAKGGVLGKLGRTIQEGSGMSAAMEATVFATPVGSFSEPFVSVVGVQIVKVLSETPGTSSRLDQREVAHILFALDGEMERTSRLADPDKKESIPPYQAASEAFSEKARRAKDRARIEVVDPAYAEQIYPFRLEK